MRSRLSLIISNCTSNDSEYLSPDNDRESTTFQDFHNTLAVGRRFEVLSDWHEHGQDVIKRRA